MSQVENDQMCYPELLSELTLRELLANSCIVLPMVDRLDKNELVEIYKRIAMPLPQRKYHVSRNLGKKLNDLRAKRGIEIASSNGDADSSSTADSSASDSDVAAKNRLKPQIAEAPQVSKKIRLSNSCHVDEINTKRKNEISSISESKKRQKITWP